MKKQLILLLTIISLKANSQYLNGYKPKLTPTKDSGFYIPKPEFHVFTLGSRKVIMKRKIGTDEWQFDSAFVLGLAKSLARYGYKLCKVKSK